MSLGVVIKGPEGIVLAADSRVTLQARTATSQLLPISFDNATKLLAFSKHRFVGAVTYGQAVIGKRTAHSFLPEFEVGLGDARLSVQNFAAKLGEFFLARWNDSNMPKDYDGPPMTFVVAGFDEGQPYGEVFVVDVPRQTKPQRRTPAAEFGMTWGGQLDIASRIVGGFDPALPQQLASASGRPIEEVNQWLLQCSPALQLPIPYEFLPLQDCISLATAMIRTTMVFQDTAIRVRGVGGPVDIAVITRTRGLVFVQRKKLRGEMGYALSGGEDDAPCSDHDSELVSSKRPAAPRRVARARR